MQGVFLDTDTLVPDELDFTAFDNMLSWTLTRKPARTSVWPGWTVRRWW